MRVVALAVELSVIRIHGVNPQYLVENIIRQRIWESPYWKESA